MLTAGEELPALVIEPINRRTLALFACASGDHQPTHLDVDAARAKGRDDVIAHGMLMMAYMSRMLTDLVPQEKIRSFSARFVAVTQVHASATARGRVVSVDNGDATLELVIILADGREVVRGRAVIDIG